MCPVCFKLLLVRHTITPHRSRSLTALLLFLLVHFIYHKCKWRVPPHASVSNCHTSCGISKIVYLYEITGAHTKIRSTILQIACNHIAEPVMNEIKEEDANAVINISVRLLFRLFYAFVNSFFFSCFLSSSRVPLGMKFTSRPDGAPNFGSSKLPVPIF